MKVQVVKEKNCEVVMQIELSGAEISQEIGIADKRILQSSRIKGFRKGKAPLDMVKNRFSAERDEAVIRSLVSSTLESALKENDIKAISTPQVKDLKYDFEKEITASFTASVEVMPEFELKRYGNFKIKKETKKVTKESVEEVLNKLRQQNASLVDSKKEIAGSEDYVIIDFQGELDGKSVKGFAGKGQLVDMSGSFISEEFVKKINGMKKGEKGKISVKLADDYYRKDLAGREVDFDVTLTEIKEKSLPADDELVKIMGMESLDKLNDSIEKNLIQNEEKKYDDSVRSDIIDYLIEWNPFPVPESLVQKEYSHLLESLQQGYGKKEFSDEEKKELKDKYYPVAEKRVKSALIFSKIIEKEGIKAEEEDIKKEKEKTASQGQHKAEDVKKFFDENIESVRDHVLTEKLFGYLIENAKIKRKYV